MSEGLAAGEVVDVLGLADDDRAEHAVLSDEFLDTLTGNEAASELRGAHHRHDQFGLTEEEAAFYGALAGGAEHVTADSGHAAIAHELVTAFATI